MNAILLPCSTVQKTVYNMWVMGISTYLFYLPLLLMEVILFVMHIYYKCHVIFVNTLKV